MPGGIVSETRSIETCPAPEFKLVDKRVAFRKTWFFRPSLKFRWKLLQSAVERNETSTATLLFLWLAADELSGDSPAFRDGVAAMNQWSFTEIKSTTQMWLTRPEVHVSAWRGRGRHPTRLRLCNPSENALTVQDLVAQVRRTAWSQATTKAGSKGPLSCSFAFLRVTESRGGLPGPEVGLASPSVAGIVGSSFLGPVEDLTQRSGPGFDLVSGPPVAHQRLAKTDPGCRCRDPYCPLLTAT